MFFVRHRSARKSLGGAYIRSIIMIRRRSIAWSRSHGSGQHAVPRLRLMVVDRGRSRHDHFLESWEEVCKGGCVLCFISVVQCWLLLLRRAWSFRWFYMFSHIKLAFFYYVIFLHCVSDPFLEWIWRENATLPMENVPLSYPVIVILFDDYVYAEYIHIYSKIARYMQIETMKKSLPWTR